MMSVLILRDFSGNFVHFRKLILSFFVVDVVVALMVSENRWRRRIFGPKKEAE